jgi:beta-galactosidase GanA
MLFPRLLYRLKHIPQIAFLLLLCLLSGSSFAHAAEMPKLVEQNGRYALMVDGKPYLILGGQINNSSAWPAVLPEVWPLLEKMHANTIEAPVYWEQMEAKPGSFDFSIVDTLVTQAREHNMHLIVLWFGTWKNGRMHYAPEWVKNDTAHYPRMIDARGEPIDVLSPNAPANLEADKRAFVALMRHLREIDGDQHTVLMAQVENEPGSLGTVRDFSPTAQKQFDGAVPAELVQTLHKHPGTWKEVFGPDADETFATYSVSHYIDQLAKAGKAEFPLPMYCNVWLGSRSQIPGVNYPSGGAVPQMLDVWKASAHSIDMIGPDIYIGDSEMYRQTLEAYHRPDNAMWIPETGSSDDYGRYFFYALAHGAIGFSPFGMDQTGWTFDSGEYPKLHSQNYALLAPMDREIAQWNFEGRLKTAVEEPGQPRTTLDFGKWKAAVTFGLPQYGEGHTPGSKEHDGRALIMQISEDEFLVTGFDARVQFELASSDGSRHMQFLRVEEGGYQDGAWKMSRLWNGDQTDFGLNFNRQQGKVVRAVLGTY